MIKKIIDENKDMDALNKKIEILKSLFPNVVKNDVIDLKILEKELNPQSIIKEGYELNFLGKSYAKLISDLNTETIIMPDIKHNSKEENKNSENIYISADNLDALKHLTKSYYNRIKCIYIDPPYNTGSDGFVYNDTFGFKKEDLINKIGVSEEEAVRIINMTSQGSSSHSAWLTFMYPRLFLAKQLLTDDGVIFVSIDDSEYANLKLLCDYIFGDNNFIGSFIVNSTPNGRDYGHIAKQHEFILFYGKNILETRTNLLPEENKQFKYSDSISGFNIHPLYNSNESFTNLNRPNLYYPFYLNKDKPIENDFYEISLEPKENSIEIFPPKSVRNGVQFVWRWGKEKSLQNLNKEIIGYKTQDGEFRVIQKMRHNEKRIRSLFTGSEYSSRRGTAEVEELLGGKIFSFPKPVELIYELLNTGVAEECYVLDFFSGSGTTAHASMRLNAENSDFKIKYIMVQLPELLNDDLEAKKIGYYSIDQIGMKRISLAAERIKADMGLLDRDIDFGFKHYTILPITTNQLTKLESFNPQILLSDNGILDEFGIDTVLTTWINYDGFGLTKSAVQLDLCGYSAYQIENTVYFLISPISDEAIKCFIEKYENDSFVVNKIVIFGYSFTMNEVQTLKDNLKQVRNIKNISLDIEVRY